jgi:ribonuclease BN (tRNA processing enzyme)
VKVVVGGTRGSFPISQRNFLRYGGDTTSFLVEGAGGERVLLDLGTGARRLGDRLRGSPTAVLVLLTHFHLDHVIGLPALSLLYEAGARIEFAAPSRHGRKIARELSGMLAPPHWPLRLERMAAALRFFRLPEMKSDRPLRRGGLRIRWAPVHHPGGCWSYRLDEPSTGASTVFATDVEWPLMTAAARARWIAWARHPAPPEALFYDGQWTPEDYEGHRGWGHSRWTDAVEVARAIGARRLWLIHHAPDRDDRALSAIERRLRAAFPRGRASRQGEVISLRAAPDRRRSADESNP